MSCVIIMTLTAGIDLSDNEIIKDNNNITNNNNNKVPPPHLVCGIHLENPQVLAVFFPNT